MTIPLSPETRALVDLAHEISCAQWAEKQGWKLRRAGSELVGSCPKCGGEDRFGINLAKDVWNCRGCGVGGDVIFLVQHIDGLRLREACERITGRAAEAPMSEEDRRRLREEREADEARKAQTAEQYRQKARSDAHEIWQAATGNSLDTLARYLTLRGLDGGCLDFGAPGWSQGMPLRFQPRRLYWHDGRELHVGPAMLAAIQAPDGRFAGIHQTWLDLARPKGKLVLPVQPGEKKPPPSKKVLGIKKRGAIRLATPENFTRLVVGEGIETTLTARVFEDRSDTAYWAAVDLGNMSGRAARSTAGSTLHDIPEMDDRDCFLPPDQVEELVYLCDGDEPEKHTVEKVTRGLRRAKRRRDEDRLAGENLPGLRIRMVPPGEAGTDLNSIVMDDAMDISD